jgi:hypothetical protein
MKPKTILLWAGFGFAAYFIYRALMRPRVVLAAPMPPSPSPAPRQAPPADAVPYDTTTWETVGSQPSEKPWSEPRYME